MLLLLACTGASEPDQKDPAEDTDTATVGSTTWTELPDGCATPTTLPTVPWTAVGAVDSISEGTMMEVIDLELDGDQLLAVGQGGIWALDVSGAPTTLGYTSPSYERYHRVERLDADHVAVTHRDQGLRVIDISDPATHTTVTMESADGLEGLHRVDALLYVTSRDEGLRTYDVSTPTAPSLVDTTDGFGIPWEIAGVGDGWAYVADAELGVVPVDLSDPSAPRAGTPVSIGTAGFHVRATPQALYVATGGNGIVTLDRADPAAPVVRSTVTTGGAVWMTAVDGDVLWAVDHEATTAWSLADPLVPTPITRIPHQSPALGITAGDGVAWVGAWTRVEGYRVDATLLAPSIDVASDTLFVAQDAVTEFSLANRGGAALTVSGAELHAFEGRVEMTPNPVPPGGEARVRLTPTGTLPDDLQGVLCLASDDPSSPVLPLPVQRSGLQSPLGEPAPDFTLPDLDGVSHSLSDTLGSPVLLVYFATW